MRAGSLDRQITVERKVAGQDAVYGAETVSWVPLVLETGSTTVGERFWCELQDALPSRSEAVMQGLAVARSQSRLRMRYRDDMDTSMRVRLHGDGADVIYQIVSGPANVMKDGRKTLMEFVIERYTS